MIRLRAHALALCALISLPVVSHAASIQVTTPFDIDRDDDLCSLREAIDATLIASRLGRREAGSKSLETNLEELEVSLLELEEVERTEGVGSPLATYPRNEMMLFMESLVDEVVDYDAEYWVEADDPGKQLLLDADSFKDKIQAIGSNAGPFDFCTNVDANPADAVPPVKVCEFPNGSALQPGYYTYRDLDGSDGSASVTVTDGTTTLTFAPDTNPADSIDNADRAYWDGEVWRKYTAIENIPVAVTKAQLIEAIALHERAQAATNSEVDRFTALAEADGCDDGSSFDTVFLEDDTVYYLNDEIVLPIRVTIKGGGKGTVIDRCVSGECASVTPAGGQHRFITIPQGMTSDIQGITFRNGDAGDGDGGALYVSSVLNMREVWFENNVARRGGAIHTGEGGSLDIEKGTFTGNRATGTPMLLTDPGYVPGSGSGGAISQEGVSVVLADCVFGGFVAAGGTDSNAPRNVANGNGGAIAVLAPVSASLKVSGNAFIGNVAQNGSALYLSGGETFLTVENTTYSRNRAAGYGTVDIDLPLTGEGTFSFNNISMLENTAQGGTAGLRVGRLLAVQVHNSIIAGNQGTGARQDCDFVAGVVEPSRNFRRNYYSNTTGTPANDCPGVRHDPLAAAHQPEIENYEPGTGPGAFALFYDAANPAQEALLNPMEEDVGLYYVPIYPKNVNDVTEIRLVNRGAAVQDEFRCAARDQRNFDRSSSVDEECDIGSVEYQIGRRSDDNIEMLVNERRCISVIADDLGDAEYVAGSLRILDVERDGFNVYVVSRVPGDAANNADVHPTLDLDDVCRQQDSGVPLTDAEMTEQFPYREAIVVEPARGFRGQTNVVYGFDWETVGTQPVQGSVTAIAHIETESRGGISTDSLGSLPLSSLVALMLLMVRRFARRSLALLALSGMTAFACAEENVIYVNSSLDEPVATTPGDGRCTLREALDSARNDRANLSGGDCNNGNEGPDVIEFVPGLTEVVLEDYVTAYGGVTLRCPLPPEPAAGEARDEPQTCTIRRRAFQLDASGAPTAVPNPKSFRLIDSRGSLSVSRITFENGQAPDFGAGREGGAIYSTGSLIVTDSVFRNNVAVDGGAIFLSGTNSALSVTRSVFIGNSSRAYTLIDGAGNVAGMTPTRQGYCPLLARGGTPGRIGTESGGGGAIASSQSDFHRITILSSSFLSNCAAYGAAAVDLNSRSPVVIANSTFSGNTSFHGTGAIDVSGALGNAILRNITVIANRSGMSQHAEAWEAAPTQRRALQFGVARVDMTSSIISSNVTEANAGVAANCSGSLAAGMRRYNVYGDEDDNPVSGIFTPGGHTCVIEANSNDRLLYAREVLDPVNPDSGLLTPLLANKVDDTTIYLYEINANPAALGVLIDAGYTEGTTAEEGQVDPGFNQSAKCANVDARGASRASGGRCDVGAFEVLGITATDDMANNFGRPDRLAIIDLLYNDLYDDISALPGRAPKDNCNTAAPAVPGPLEELEPAVLDSSGNEIEPAVMGRGEIYRFTHAGVDANGDGQDDICAEVTVPAKEVANTTSGNGTVRFLRKGIPADDELVNGDPKSNYVVLFDNHDVLRDEDVDLDGRIILRYRVFTVDQTPSNEAEISIGIDNVPPQAKSDLISVAVGQSASIDLLANDEDADSDDTSSLKITSISGTGCSPRYATPEDEDAEVVDHWRCQFGEIRLVAPGTLTFKPSNSFNPFSQDVSYEISDQDPQRPKVSKGSVRFQVGRPVANAGGILGQDDLSDMLGIDFLGAGNGLFLGTLLLALFRRRAVR